MGLRLVSEAADFAARRHSGMARKGRGNEPYVNHLAEVANLLAIATDGTDAELVAAGWLHDTIEDTETTREGLAQMFGERVAALVVEVTGRHDLAEGSAPAEADRRCAEEISGGKADQDRRQDQQYPRAYPAAAEPDELEDLIDYVAWAEKVVAGCRGSDARASISVYLLFLIFLLTITFLFR